MSIAVLDGTVREHGGGHDRGPARLVARASPMPAVASPGEDAAYPELGGAP
jgi:hypothetical protein